MSKRGRKPANQNENEAIGGYVNEDGLANIAETSFMLTPEEESKLVDELNNINTVDPVKVEEEVEKFVEKIKEEPEIVPKKEKKDAGPKRVVNGGKTKNRFNIDLSNIKSTDTKNILQVYIKVEGDVDAFKRETARLGYSNVQVAKNGGKTSILWNGNIYSI